MTAIAFDVYGTLIDTAGVKATLSQIVGDKAEEFSNLWRTKQLEYTWRYGLMGHYQNFRVCTHQALDFCDEQLECRLTAQNKANLMAKYLELPVFDDVMTGLEQLRAKNVALYAFSNGVPEDLEKLLKNAQVIDFMDGIVSVDEDQTFKPNPVVYQRFMQTSKTCSGNAWLVSSNGFDVCGAAASGMKTIWLQRNPTVKFDHWEFKPTHVVSNFSQISKIF